MQPADQIPIRRSEKPLGAVKRLKPKRTHFRSHMRVSLHKRLVAVMRNSHVPPLRHCADNTEPLGLTQPDAVSLHRLGKKTPKCMIELPQICNCVRGWLAVI